jgi:hypothetical protein
LGKPALPVAVAGLSSVLCTAGWQFRSRPQRANTNIMTKPLWFIKVLL